MDTSEYMRTALQGMDDLDVALLIDQVDSVSAAVVVEEIRSAYTFRHAAYCEQGSTTGEYRLKPDILKYKRNNFRPCLFQPLVWICFRLFLRRLYVA